MNPIVASHGGEVHARRSSTMSCISMSGGCQGCGLADITLRHGVDAAIREAVPEIGWIHDLTNHAKGATPYRASGRSPFALEISTQLEAASLVQSHG